MMMNDRTECPCRRWRRHKNTTTYPTIAMSLLTIFQANPIISSFYARAFTMTPQSSTDTQTTRTTPLAFSSSSSVNFSAQPLKSNKPLHRLTHQEEVSYLRQMRSYPVDSTLSQLARETLLLHNLPLVQSIVTKELKSRHHLQLQLGSKSGSPSSSFSTPSFSNTESKVGAALTRDDLLHEGTIGLAEALDRYDLAYAYTEPKSADEDDNETPLPKGARLGTYATYWIRARIVRAIQSREHVIRFPERVLQASHRLVKAAKDLGVDWTDVVEMADTSADSSSSLTSTKQQQRDALQQAAGLTSDFLFREAVRVRSMSTSRSHTPLESWMYPTTSSADQHAGEDELESSSPAHIRETLSKFLKPREIEVLSLRYGLISADEDEEVANRSANASSRQRVFRDYQAEAEEDLFGPNGILSHYSAVPSDARSVSEMEFESTSKKMMQEENTSPSIRAKTRASPTTLLPFTEIGKKMKFSGEYCRRTCSAALNKLTRAAEEGRLAESDFRLGW